MQVIRQILWCVGLYLILSPALSYAAKVGKQENVQVTVYNQNLGLIREQRQIELNNGLNELSFTEVAAQINPTSVHFISLTSPQDCLIKEQNYEYDLVSSDKLLTKYLDKEIKIITKDGNLYQGTLLSFDEETVVLLGQSLKIVERENIRETDLSQLPSGLMTKPTLTWHILSKEKKTHLAELSYLTSGINWRADYVAVIDKSDKFIDLSGWVTIDNRSGASYQEAQLKLVAGDIHQAPPEEPVKMKKKGVLAASAEDLSQFQEKEFFEYHIYTLAGKTTIKDNQTKQISLLSATGVPVKKIYLFESGNGGYYRGGNGKQRVKVMLELKNSQSQGLGIPLPKGILRAYKEDVDRLEFVGEDQIVHTPKDEMVRVYLGDAFDVTGKRIRTNYRKISSSIQEEDYKISLANHKKEGVEITVVDHFYGDWEIIKSSLPYTKSDAQTIEFKVMVEPDKEVEIYYTVRTQW